jgi:hypothetical protein
MSGEIRAASVCRAPESGCLTSTGIGLSAGLSTTEGAADVVGAAMLGRSISRLRFCNTSEARSRVPLPAATPRKLCIFSWRVD